jgi:hypothetical protein
MSLSDMIPRPKQVRRVIDRNLARCLRCGSLVESKFTHDWQECKCGAIFVDGGQSYLRRGGDLKNLKEESTWRDEPIGSGNG